MTPAAAKRVVAGMVSAGLDFVTFLPETRLVQMLPLLQANEAFTVVRASHEGSAVAMACGAALVGRRPAVYMEASGLFVALYSILTVAIRCGLPVVLLVSHTGSLRDKGTNYIFAPYGGRTEGVLQGMRIPYRVMSDGERSPEGVIEEGIADMVRAAHAAKSPACMLFDGDFTIGGGMRK